MKLSYMSTDAIFVLDSVWDARLELITFSVAILLYWILFKIRTPAKGNASQKSACKVVEEQESFTKTCGRATRAKSQVSEVVDKQAQHGKSSSTKKDTRIVAPKNSSEQSRPDVAKHIVMIRKYACEQNLSGAMSVFESLEALGVELNSIVYNTVLDACVKCNDLEAAHSWIERARRADMIDVVSFNTLLKAYLANGDIRKARDIVRDMKRSGFEPNRVTFNEFVNAIIARGGCNADIWDVVKEMRGMGITPDQVTCSILLKNLNARSTDMEVQNTMDLVGSIDEPMDEVLMSSVVEACVRIGKTELLTKQLQQLQGGSRLPASNSHTFGSLIKAYRYAHDVDSVWRCWRDMRSQLIKPTSITLGCMVEALVSNACTEDAYELIQHAQSDPHCQDSVNSVIYCSLMKGFSREKKLERVWIVYNEMKQLNIEMSLVSYNTLLDACARVGRMDYVSMIAEGMKQHNVEANIITFSTIIKGHCQAGNIELGFSVLHQMKRETKFKPDEIMYNSLLNGCAQNSMYEEGVQLFAEMRKEGVPPSNFTLSILVKLMNRAHRVDEAFAIVQDVSQQYGLKPNAHVYTNLIQACVSNRRHHRALSVLEMMVQAKVKPDSRTYGVLIRASIFHNQCDQAVGLLRAALGLPGALEMLSDVRFAACSPVDESMVNSALSSLAERGFMESLVQPILADLKNSRQKVWIDPAIHRTIATNTVAEKKGKGKGKGNR